MVVDTLYLVKGESISLFAGDSVLEEMCSFSAEVSGRKNIVSLIPDVEDEDNDNLYWDYTITGDKVGETKIKMKFSTNRTTWFNVIVIDSEDDLPDFTLGK